MENDVLLRMQGVSKSFPGVRALDNVSLDVRRGTVHALMGENGAGKSTLMKCLFGIYTKDSGKILLEGKEVSFKTSKEALDCGVAMVHQELNQALKRSVADNIWLGRYPTKGPLVQEKKMHEDTREIFKKLGIDVNPAQIMGSLPVARRQMAEIAKAVSYNARVIVFDEPTSSLNDAEVEQLFRIIDMLKKGGTAIIYISHKMEEILRISDDITVMRDGRHIATEPAKNMTMEKIIKLMVGRELGNRFPERKNKPGKPLLEVEGLTSRYSNLRDVSFTLRESEIIGVAGLDGAGRTELLENIFGLSARERGRLVLRGREIKNRNARDSISNGFALVTEERRSTGIFGILSIRANTTVSSLKKYLSYGFVLNKKKMRRATDDMIKSLRIKTPTQDTKIRSLSGGNQQKVIFGRWLLTEPDILLLDEPTRGIDVGAKFEIYSVIGNLAANGKSVIMVSSEMPELLGVCDRILVMSGGRLAGEVNAKDATQEQIMTLATKYA
ncbi:MAG: sugar ABC transporter ATP-binding protein [Oscillospiraceae bacterium]|nr:sugar ABC transporter ATP-binding protein [Oscillospiraceae bacterium]